MDEVTSGLRYGFPGAMARLGVEPDLVVYAKAMSNGFPFGVVVGRNSVMQQSMGSFISSSYWTDGVGPAAALAVLAKIQRIGLFDLLWDRGTRFQASLRDVAARHPRCALTIGGMPTTPTLTFNLGPDAPLAQTLYVRRMRERGFLVASYSYVMLAQEDDDRVEMLAALDETLAEISRSIAAGRLEADSGVARGLRGFARLA